jgi:hypothetical protein
MSKRTPKENARKRPRFDIREDTPKSDSDKENASQLPPMTPGTRKKQVNRLLPEAVQYRGLTLHLINRIRAGAPHSPQEVANLRLIAAFSSEIRSYLLYPTTLD